MVGIEVGSNMDEGSRGCLLVGSRECLDLSLHLKLEYSSRIAQGDQLVFVEA